MLFMLWKKFVSVFRKQVPEQFIGKCLVERGELQCAVEAGQGYAPLPAGNDGGTFEMQFLRNVRLGISREPPVLAKPFADGFV